MVLARMASVSPALSGCRVFKKVMKLDIRIGRRAVGESGLLSGFRGAVEQVLHRVARPVAQHPLRLGNAVDRSRGGLDFSVPGVGCKSGRKQAGPEKRDG
ncbi:hypothetical protein GCM10022408_05950 [Hymenobacter fastidiosus]|uniref:Uncharacterized protein n=1 Tax=Hymenobacter fastidiosus TaxID=486264 RepID=A0ABP7RII6_9BACT